MRKRQLQDIFGNNVIYTGTDPLHISASPGVADTTWFDFTDYVSGLDKIELEWTAEQTEFGQVKAGEFAAQKGVSGTLQFERNAYDWLKTHLIDDVAATLNQVEVQITDIGCGKYVGYAIKSTQLSWCEFNSTCVFELNLKQIEDFTNCIQRTLIADNWQGWFQNEPLDIHTLQPKKHPRFGYCIEKRPNWTLVLEWFLTAIVAFIYTVVYLPFYAILVVLNILVLAINGIISVINLIIDAVNTLPGISISHIPDIPSSWPPSPGDIVEGWATLMVENAGCGREHPAPLIRDYITNVCSKCGVRVNATTADIFFAPFLTLTHSDAELHTDPNPHYNACYFFPQVVRGVRRFRSIDLLTGNSSPDTTTYYLPANAPELALDMFLDELNKIYNTQWRIIVDSAGDPYLWIKRKDWFVNEPPSYDFSYGGADRDKIIEGICYDPQDITVPASCSDLYEDDPADKCGVEAEAFYNGTQPISFNNTTNNPIFKGVLDKQSGFAATHFNCDGTSTNYIYDALQFVRGSAINVLIFFINAELGTLIESYANYKILLQTEQVSKPKIIIWDGDTDNPGDPNYLNATAVRDKINIAGTVFTIGHSGWPGTVGGIDVPDINTLYPTQIPSDPVTLLTLAVPASIPDPTMWAGPITVPNPRANHQPQTNVIGTSVTGVIPDGVYGIIDTFGSVVNATPAILVNYPMYFEPHYKGTLWDWFHWIDDPYKNPRLLKQWKLKISLCCEDIIKLNLTGNVNGQKLLASVLLDTTFYNKGVITSIKVGYDTGNESNNQGVGQYIELKGIV